MEHSVLFMTYSYRKECDLKYQENLHHYQRGWKGRLPITLDEFKSFILANLIALLNYFHLTNPALLQSNAIVDP